MTTDKDREAFEKDFKLSDLNRDIDGNYCHKDTRRLWNIYSKGWQAALRAVGLIKEGE